MKLSIPAKLFLAILAACALVLVVNGIAERFSFERVFLSYLNEQGVQRMEQLAVRVENEYRRHGDWQFLRGKPDAWFQLVWPPSTDTKEAWSRPPPFPDQTGVILRIALFDEQDRRLLGNPAAAAPGAKSEEHPPELHSLLRTTYA